MNDKTHLAMAAEDGSDRARRLIGEAGPLLGPGIPPDFVGRLLGRAAPEDVLVYTARDLARLAQNAWELLAERKPGAPKLRLQGPSGGDRLADIAVLEIINDDKPFLL